MYQVTITYQGDSEPQVNRFDTLEDVAYNWPSVANCFYTDGFKRITMEFDTLHGLETIVIERVQE